MQSYAFKKKLILPALDQLLPAPILFLKLEITLSHFLDFRIQNEKKKKKTFWLLVSGRNSCMADVISGRHILVSNLPI